MDNIVEKLALKGDRILVKQIKSEDKVGSFYIPDTVKSKIDKRHRDAWKGEVMGLGDMVDNTMLRHNLTKGDIVYCDPVSLDCPKFIENDNNFVIITDEDVLAIEEKETN